MTQPSDRARKAAQSVLYCTVPDSFTANGQFKLDMDAVAQVFATFERETLAAGVEALLREGREFARLLVLQPQWTLKAGDYIARIDAAIRNLTPAPAASGDKA